MHVFADSNAQGLGEQPQWLYGLAFEGTELWGADADPGLRVGLDAWESTLEAAQAAGDADLGDSCCRHWLAALEDLVERKGAADAAELARCVRAWDHAADGTPHGQPIVLQAGDFRP